MSVTNGYATLTEVKSALRLTDTVDDAALEVSIEAASRMLEGHCGRRFYADTTTSARTYVASNPYHLTVDDFLTTTGLVVKTDTALDATWSTTITAANVQSEPLNALRDGVGWAYTALSIVGSSASYFPCVSRQALVQVTAKWGWPAVPHEIRQACIIQTAALMKAVDAPLGIAGFGDMGGMRLRQSLHPSAAALAAPFRVAVAVA